MTEWRLDRRAFEPEAVPRRGFDRRWLIGGVAALALIVGATLWLNRPDLADLVAATPVPSTVAPGVAAAKGRPGATTYPPVTLPSGLQVDHSSAANYDLAAWLAQNPAHPRSFTFDRVGFDVGSAAIRDQDRPALQVLTQILTAYPQARVTIIANGPGTLAEERAGAIRDALFALAVDPAQVTMERGDESERAPRMLVRVELGPVDGLDA